MLGYDLVLIVLDVIIMSQVNYTRILGDDEVEDNFRSWGYYVDSLKLKVRCKYWLRYIGYAI